MGRDQLDASAESSGYDEESDIFAGTSVLITRSTTDAYANRASSGASCTLTHSGNIHRPSHPFL